MPVTEPPVTASLGNISIVMLSTIPANLASIPIAAITAGKNVTCHTYGDWLPDASINKVNTKRKTCKKTVPQRLGTATHNIPALQYSYMPQSVGTAGAAGNEAYELLPEDAIRVAIIRLGKDGETDLATGDKYIARVIQCGPQVPGVSQEDEGGDFVINQEFGWAPGYSEPINGVITS